MELDPAALALLEVEPVEHPHEIEVPEGAAEFAVGHRLEARILLHLDDALDRLVLDLGKLLGVHRLVFVVGLAGLLDRIRTEETADDIGAVRGFLDGHLILLVCPTVGGRNGRKQAG